MGGPFGLAGLTMENSENETLTVCWASSAATRCGPKHDVNEDCFDHIDEAGYFVVADGVGGHTDGGVASRAVIEMLRCVIEADSNLDARVLALEQALHSVNRALWRESQQRPQPTMIASTVATLMLSKGYAVCLWAGDSRIYVHRAGHLYQLTQDHNVGAESGFASHDSSALTRAIGAGERLELGRLVTPAEPGDTFLVCSDGVTKFMQDIELANFLEDPLEGLAMRIIAAIVDREGNDDATAIVVRYTGADPE
jgi:serine/threonine protein phosphatase PrpC